jgi:hypothetical protein
MEFLQSMGTDFAIGWAYWVAVGIAVIAILGELVRGERLEYMVDITFLPLLFLLMYNGYWMGYWAWLAFSVLATLSYVYVMFRATEKITFQTIAVGLIIRVVTVTLVGLQI